MKLLLLFLLLYGAVPAFAQYGWQEIDTLTRGDFQDLNPQPDNGKYNPYPLGLSGDTWVIFERHGSGSSSIAAVRFVGDELRWDTTVTVISSPGPGTIRKDPDICSIPPEAYFYPSPGTEPFTLAVWEEKYDTNSNIYYSILWKDSASWSPPVRLTNDSGKNERPRVRVLNDTSLIVLWKSGSALYYSIATDERFTPPRVLAVSNIDSVEFDFARYVYGSYMMFVRTNRGQTGDRYCIMGRVSGTDSLALSDEDTVAVRGDIGNPRLRMSYMPILTFDALADGRYSAWMANTYGADQWPNDSEAIDTASDNLRLGFFSPPELVAGVSSLRKPSVSFPWGFSVWERRTVSDTTLIFYHPGPTGSAGCNRNPQIATSVYPVGWGTMMGFAVFENCRFGAVNIHARRYYYSLGAVDEPQGSPSGFRLEQNYPNPFNPTTAIRYRLSSIGNVSLAVYDVLGRKVRTLVNERQSPGEHTVVFDGSGLASGVYFYRLEAGSIVQSRKMLLVK